jgi:hypothetical protein
MKTKCKLLLPKVNVNEIVLCLMELQSEMPLYSGAKGREPKRRMFKFKFIIVPFDKNIYSNHKNMSKFNKIQCATGE